MFTTLDAVVPLAIAFSLMPAAQILSLTLPKGVAPKYRYLFLWHTYDALTHFIIEGPYLYHCFFSHLDGQYGSNYATGPMARLWQEYAKADARWGGADLTIMSLEILTVGLAGPGALYIAYLVSRIASGETRLKAKMWFLASILATGELYGGFITFCPEWLSGNTNLATDDPVYLWLYLVFFNVLWVFVPFWVLYEAWIEINKAFREKVE